VRRLLVLLAPLALLGCGGSHPHGFAAQGDAICRDVSKKVGDLPRPTKIADIQDYVTKASRIERDGLQRMRALKPPARLRATATAYENLIAREIDLSIQVGAAAAKNDAARQQRLNTQGNALGAQATAAARKIGFKDCSK
jgi:hypothetical protein